MRTEWPLSAHIHPAFTKLSPYQANELIGAAIGAYCYYDSNLVPGSNSMKLLVAILPVAALLLAAPAHADEASYITVVSQWGTNVSNRAAIIRTGMTACDALRGGSSYLDVAKAVVSANYTARDAGRIIYAAVTQLCPDQLTNVNAQVNGLEGPSSPTSSTSSPTS